MDYKKIAQKYYKQFLIVSKVYNTLIGRNRIRVKKKLLESNGALFKNCKIYINGENNNIHVGKFSRLNKCFIDIKGKNNSIWIGDNVYLNEANICIEDDGNSILIGDRSSIQGTTHLAAIEGTKIEIGTDCLFSGEIQLRTGDSHSILNIENQRINPSKDIYIGNHVWIGTRVTILKGVNIPDECIVGACSLVTKKFEENNCIIAGNPGSVIKNNVSWCHNRMQ